MKLSVIVPVYNEGTNVKCAHDTIFNVLKEHLKGFDLEIIFVDDGSRDDSFSQLLSLAKKHTHVRVIKLSGNVGPHMAIRAGLDKASGDYACFIACDLQDPPELIPQMIESCIDPVQIVWAVREQREDSLFTKLSAKLFYLLARTLVTKNLPPGGSSMFLLGPKALKTVRLYPERNLTLEGLFANTGFPMAYVPYQRRRREFGKSKWTLSKKIKLFTDFFVAYSYIPIRLISIIGIFTAIMGLIYAALVLIRALVYNSVIPGWSSLMLVVLILGGIQMIMLGIIGEYLWRTLDEARKRPCYIIETTLGFEQQLGPDSNSLEVVQKITC